MAGGLRNGNRFGHPDYSVGLQLQAKNAPGMTLLPAGPTLAAADGSNERVRQSYRVEDSEKLGSLQWSSAPPRVNVLIESQITIHPDSAEWVAGPPLRRLRAVRSIRSISSFPQFGP